MTDFAKSVYDTLCTVPRGRVVTYGQLALLCGRPGASRAVGNILHKNPTPVLVPCHRVVNHNGCLARGFAFGGAIMQRSLLEDEGVAVSDEMRVDLKKYLWQCDCP
jgi:methylated-DNA-protein-cysteine methyltransferase-like protein